VNVRSRIARGLGTTAMAAVLLAGCTGAQAPASSTGVIPTGTPRATLAPSLPPTPQLTIRPTTAPTPGPTATSASAPEISVAWTRHYGTSAEDGASAIAVDDGGITVVGTTSGTYETPLPGGSDGFIQRYDLAGEVLWTRQFGTRGQDWAKDVAADAGGLTVLWASDGSFEGTGRDNAKNLFLRRYDRSGTVLWTTSYVTAGDEDPGGIAADATGLTVVGTTMGVGGDILTAPTPEPIEAIVLRYDLDGRLQWTRQFGSPEPAKGDAEGYRAGVHANAVAIDAAGFTIGGGTGGDLAAPNAGPSSSTDAFIRRYDPDGNVLWTRQWGQPGGDDVTSLAADATGITAVGLTSNSVYFDEIKPTQAFILRYDLAGELLWSEIFGSPDEDVAHGVTADAAALTVTGHTYGSLEGPNKGTSDVFVRRYDLAGEVIWASQFGTSDADLGMDVAADAAGFTVVGHTSGSLGGAAQGELDLFVRRYSR
jgi:hypothetical protein